MRLRSTDLLHVSIHSRGRMPDKAYRVSPAHPTQIIRLDSFAVWALQASLAQVSHLKNALLPQMWHLAVKGRIRKLTTLPSHFLDRNSIGVLFFVSRMATAANQAKTSIAG